MASATVPGEIYECGCADIPEGDCDCDGNQLDALGVCGGICAADTNGNGICDNEEDCLGVIDECGICDGPGAIYECGCSDIPEGDCDCDGNVLDECGVCGGDGIAEEIATVMGTNSTPSAFAEVIAKRMRMAMDSATTMKSWGAQDSAACNYDASATFDDGSCAEIDACGVWEVRRRLRVRL